MIDARSDLCAAVNNLQTLCAILLERQGRFEKALGYREKYSIADLAERYGAKPDTLARAPWRLPNYGRADFGECPKYWWRETVDAWEAYGFENHRRDWETMSADDKRRVQGVAA